VLAALPILATGEQVLAAGSAGAAAAQSASSGGAGASFTAGITTFFYSLFSLLSTLVVGVGIFLGIWSGLRNAPTLRARQFMIKVSLGYLIVGSLVLMFWNLNFLLLNYVESNRRAGDAMSEFLQALNVGAYLCMIGGIPVFVLVSSFLVNRRWRKIVEEDLAKTGMESSEMTGLRSVYLWIGIAICSFLLAMIVSATFNIRVTDSPVSLVIWNFCLGLIILMFILWFFRYAVQISRDDECFAKYPPRLPNLLPILTGEEKAPRGFRNRINFWGDLTGIGLGWSAVPVIVFSLYYSMRMPIEYVFVLHVSLFLLAYFLFAVFFAGIPRRRYWGMIFLGVSVLLIDTGVLLIHLMLSEAKIGILGFAYAVSVWYLLCFTLLGVGGLWVFRKRKE
jgi:hypothetical protein